MTDDWKTHKDPMLELFIYETGNLLDQMEEIIISVEAQQQLELGGLEELTHCAHVIRGSATMMLFREIAHLSGDLEQLFNRAKEGDPKRLDYDAVCEVVLEALDFIRGELKSLTEGVAPDKSASALINRIAVLKALYGVPEDHPPSSDSNKQKYYITNAGAYKRRTLKQCHVRVDFEANCKMENIRAFTVLHNIRELCVELYHRPKDIIKDSNATDWIIENGFQLYFTTESSEKEIRLAIEDVVLIRSYTFEILETIGPYIQDLKEPILETRARGEPEPIVSVPWAVEETPGQLNLKAQGLPQDIYPLEAVKLDMMIDIVEEMLSLITTEGSLKCDESIREDSRVRELAVDILGLLKDIRKDI